MADPTLKRLVDDARVEMGEEVFREFADSLSGRKRTPPRERTTTCAICEGSGIGPELAGGGPCAGCDGTGKF